MSSVQLKDLKGKAVGEVKFDEAFAIEPNVHVMHSALHRQLANARAGTASTKTRSEVRGGGRKPWRQKGTGQARAGSIRSPLWNGGGVIFGPKPRDYYQSMPKKARQLALRSAIAARRDQFTVVKSFDGLFKSAPKAGEKAADQPKTKAFLSVLKDLELADKHLVVVLIDSAMPGAQQIERAARNINNVRVLNINNLNVKDLLESEVVLTSEHTVGLLNDRFKAHKSEKAKLPVKRQPSVRTEVKSPEQKAKEAAEKLKVKIANKKAKAAEKAEARKAEAEAKASGPKKEKGAKDEGAKGEGKGEKHGKGEKQAKAEGKSEGKHEGGAPKAEGGEPKAEKKSKKTEE